MFIISTMNPDNERTIVINVPWITVNAEKIVVKRTFLNILSFGILKHSVFVDKLPETLFAECNRFFAEFFTENVIMHMLTNIYSKRVKKCLDINDVRDYLESNTVNYEAQQELLFEFMYVLSTCAWKVLYWALITMLHDPKTEQVNFVSALAQKYTSIPANDCQQLCDMFVDNINDILSKFMNDYNLSLVVEYDEIIRKQRLNFVQLSVKVEI